MSCIFIKNQDIDPKRWDRCIKMAQNGLPYAYTWYLNAISDHWDAIVYNDYEAIMPLPFNYKMGLRSLYTPFFAQQLGIFYQNKADQTLYDLFLKAIPPFHKTMLNLNFGNNFTANEYKKINLNNYTLSLEPDYKTINKNYNKNTQRNIKKAELNFWHIQNNHQAIDCLNLFKKNKGQKLGQSKQFYKNALAIMEKSIERKQGEIWGAINPAGELHASAFILYSHNRLINLLPATSNLGKAQGAMFLLLDQIIQKHAESQKIFDFEGSMVEGVARFYKGFGAQLEPYWRLEQKKIPWYLKIPFKAYKTISR